LEWTDQSQKTDMWQTLLKASVDITASFKSGEFIGSLSNYQLPKDSAPRRIQTVLSKCDLRKEDRTVAMTSYKLCHPDLCLHWV